VFVLGDKYFKEFSYARIMHQDHHLFLYQIQILQLRTDANLRLSWFLGLYCCHWWGKFPHGWFHEQTMCGFGLSLMSISITHLVWSNWLFGACWVVIALSGHSGIIERYRFENADGNIVAVNTERYIELMRKKSSWKQGVDMDLDSSAGWSNSTLLQCFIQIPPLVLTWTKAYS